MKFPVESEAFHAPVVRAGAGTVHDEDARSAKSLCLFTPVDAEASRRHPIDIFAVEAEEARL